MPKLLKMQSPRSRERAWPRSTSRTTPARASTPRIRRSSFQKMFWVHRDLEDCIARLERYAEAGADMVFPTLAGPREIAEVRRRVARPLMVVNNPEEEHTGAAIVLYYAFSVATQFAALRKALA